MTSDPDAPPPPQENAERVVPYLARILQLHLLSDPEAPCWSAPGTALFADVSGFTQLSEQLARKGREGAEQIADTIGGSFASILKVAYENGASLLKFGGDALLLWFQDYGHAARACAAAVRMRGMLDDVGRIELPGASVTLRMSQGVHTGTFDFFAVGASHLEMLPVGPAWSRTVAMEHAAGAGRDPRQSGDRRSAAEGMRRRVRGRRACCWLANRPATTKRLPYVPRPKMAPEPLLRCLSPAIRAHVQAGGGTSEHRPVTIAFIRFEGTDALIEKSGAAAAAEALHRLVSIVEAATEEQGVAFLGSDVDADGGKLILTAGAPTATGDDEDRMLLALRKIVESDPPIPLRIGVHRGAVFAGDIGPAYRRTYTVMGDAVNLTARLMAKAEPGHIYATADILDRANTLFATTKLEPFAVKGKAEPVQAWSVGRAEGSRTRQVSLQRLPLTGRNAELGIVRKTFTSARSGEGRLHRARRRFRNRQDPAAGSAARRGRGIQQAARGLRGVHVVDPVRRVARAAARDAGLWAGVCRSGHRRAHSRRGDEQGTGSRTVAAAARRRARRRDCAHARSRDARGKESPREAARDRRPVPSGDRAGQDAVRDRRRAPHGRGVGRAARLPDQRHLRHGRGCSPWRAAPAAPGSRPPKAPRSSGSN